MHKEAQYLYDSLKEAIQNSCVVSVIFDFIESSIFNYMIVVCVERENDTIFMTDMVWEYNLNLNDIKDIQYQDENHKVIDVFMENGDIINLEIY